MASVQLKLQQCGHSCGRLAVTVSTPADGVAVLPAPLSPTMTTPDGVAVLPTPPSPSDAAPVCLLLDLLDQDALDCVLLAVQRESLQLLLARLGQTCKALRRLSEKVRSDVVLQRLSTRWDPASPRAPMPSALPAARRFLDALTERSRGNKRVLCYVTRVRGVRAQFGFHLQLDDGARDLHCFSARRHVLGRARGLCHTITLHQKTIAEVWYDASTSEFLLYEHCPAEACEDASEDDIGCWPLQSKVWPGGGRPGGGRKGLTSQPAMRVSIRRSRIRPRSVRVHIPPQAGGSPKGGEGGEGGKAGGLGAGGSEFINLEPRWDDSLKHYVLKYYSRATRASVKNVQLKPAESVVAHRQTLPWDDVAFLVGKVADDRFNVDFKAPFSFLHAFALALTIVDSAYFGVI